MTAIKMDTIKVRFNLGRGKNYMKWKIQHNDHVEYVSPEDKNIWMFGCQLKNNRKTAEKILRGEHKTVCAWITCQSVTVQNKELPTFKKLKKNRLKYNPKVLPYWNIRENDVDNQLFDIIFSDGRELYVRELKDMF